MTHLIIYLKYLVKCLYKKRSPAELLFNAVLWNTKTRMWGCSRNFSKIMKPEIEECEDWECSEVYLCDKSEPEESILIWNRELREKRYLLRCCKSLADCKDEGNKGVWTDSDYWERKKKRDIILMNKIFQADKAELLGIFVPFWKRQKIESIDISRWKLTCLLVDETK